MEIRSVVHFGALPSSKRKRSMRPLKQGIAAIALIASMGIVGPSAFGGSAAADPGQGNGQNPTDEFTFLCDIGGTTVTYSVISQSNSSKVGFHDLNSSTVLIYQADQRFTRYVPFGASPYDPAHVDIPGRLRGPKEGGNANGQDGNVVACIEAIGPDQRVGDITACTGAATASLCPPLISGVHYDVYAGRTWYVTFSAGGQGAGNAASVGNHSHSKHRH